MTDRADVPAESLNAAQPDRLRYIPPLTEEEVREALDEPAPYTSPLGEAATDDPVVGAALRIFGDFEARLWRDPSGDDEPWSTVREVYLANRTGSVPNGSRTP